MIISLLALSLYPEFMETVYLILGIICLLVGLAGAILPIPGPPLSYAGLVLLYFSHQVQVSPFWMWTFGIATVIISVLDYLIPIWGSQKFGGTKYGSIGSMVGLLAGLFFIPGIGLFIGAFLGALVGELIKGLSINLALKSATGAFLGLITGVFLKTVLCVAILVYGLIGLL